MMKHPPTVPPDFRPYVDLPGLTALYSRATDNLPDPDKRY
jgi:hypothetical protein